MTNPENKRLECIISGRVQMVMFRDFTRRNAQSLGLFGYVTNLPDGKVKVIAEGPEGKLLQLLTLLHRGPVLAKVKGIDPSWQNATGEFTAFEIRYKNLLDRL